MLHQFSPLLAVSAIAVVGATLSVTKAQAVTMNIQSLYNTGVDNNGQALFGNTTDPHYTLVSQPSGGVVTNSTVPSGTFPLNKGGPWLPNSSTSNWIGSNSNSSPAGDYTFQTTFNLPNEAILSTAQILGQWTADNTARIFLNGFDTGNVKANGNSFKQTYSFSINHYFQFGNNTLSFVVNNSNIFPSSPVGLRVAAISGTYEAVPEPLTILGSIAALGFGAKMERKFRRKKAKKAESEA
jgi:hypothetical protein